jgi:integrase
MLQNYDIWETTKAPSKVVQERLGHATISTTLDLYSHVTPGLQQTAAKGFDKMLSVKRENEAIKNLVSFLLAILKKPPGLLLLWAVF